MRNPPKLSSHRGWLLEEPRRRAGPGESYSSTTLRKMMPIGEKRATYIASRGAAPPQSTTGMVVPPVAGRGKAGEACEDCQTVDNRLARKTFVRSTNFFWLAYCWWNNEMLQNTDFTDALVDKKSSTAIHKSNYWFLDKSYNCGRYHLATLRQNDELMWSIMYYLSKRKCTEKKQ